MPTSIRWLVYVLAEENSYQGNLGNPPVDDKPAFQLPSTWRWDSRLVCSSSQQMRQDQISLVVVSRWHASETSEGIPLEGMHCTCRLYTAIVGEETVLARRLVTDRVHTSLTEIHWSPVVCRQHSTVRTGRMLLALDRASSELDSCRLSAVLTRPSHWKSQGAAVPWDLRFRNTGFYSVLQPAVKACTIAYIILDGNIYA